MIHLIFVTKYRNKDRNNLKLHRKIAPKWGRSFLIKSVKLDPFAECDAILKILIYLALQFQSTPSLRKVTARIAAIRTAQTFQSTPSLRKVTGSTQSQNWQIQLFQSTPSLRKVTRTSQWDTHAPTISIHTFLTEGDKILFLQKPQFLLFQSTPSLRKVTYSEVLAVAMEYKFNPHLPYGR